MKFFTDKKIINRIIIAIIIVTIINFMSPTISKAITLDEKGGDLFAPICDALYYFADLIIGALQQFFIGEELDLGPYNPRDYKIKYSPGVIFSGKVASLDVNFFDPGQDYEGKVSSAAILQPIVATWYKVLRAIALVGLLSVLVYIGIRILISSTGQEKAKYKKMIGDWFAAICLLFVLQYIMIFILEISDAITKILSVNVIQPDGEDVLMTTIRRKLGVDNRGFTAVFAELIIYLVLVIYTIIFTFKYLKRLLYMAFFTMIAPLIALTYPLDKIKDGQAQAFTIWLREYIFNSLLQPMHLLLYYIFVTSAEELTVSNWIYAIVAIGFLIPAEKFFRKMFGFDKAESSGQMGAAAAGALAMNTINSLSNKTKKQTTGGGSGGGNSQGTPRYIQGPGAGSTGESISVANPARTNSSGNTGRSAGAKTNGKGNTTFGQTVEKAGGRGNVSIKNGARTLTGHYINGSNARKLGKGMIKGAVKGAVGIAGAATLGTVGLAIGTATGDASKALGYGAAGAGAGFSVGSNLANRGMEFEKKNRELYKEGALGTGEYNTRNSIKELTNDNDFNRTCKTLGIKDQKGREETIRQFYSNGIKSSAEIKKAMNARVKTKASQEQVIAAYKIKKDAKNYGLNTADIRKKLISQDIEGEELKYVMSIIDML